MYLIFGDSDLAILLSFIKHNFYKLLKYSRGRQVLYKILVRIYIHRYQPCIIHILICTKTDRFDILASTSTEVLCSISSRKRMARTILGTSCNGMC